MRLSPARRGRRAQGVGRRLWHHALETARAFGFRHLVIIAGPHAEGISLAMGAVRTGEIPSEVVPGRDLPELRVTLSPG